MGGSPWLFWSPQM